MIDIAFAMGQGGQGGTVTGQSAGGLVPFVPIILLLLIVMIVWRIVNKYLKKKKHKQIILNSKCETCGIVYTKGEKFCKKCGNPLG